MNRDPVERANGGRCITCSDAGETVHVIEVDRGDALCRDGDGRTRRIGVELLGDVAPGDVLLVHAGVALARLDEGGAP